MAEKQESGLARRDPFGELMSLDPWAGFGDLSRRLESLFGERRSLASLVPAVDVTESDGEYTITAELPGVKKDDVTVEVDQHVLTLRGEKKSEREETKEKARILERTYGAFTRSFTLPADADEERLTADFKDGVLKITVPRRPESKPVQVAIKG